MDEGRDRPVSYTHLDVYKRQVQSLDDASAAALLELDTEPGRPVAARLPEELE